ncbi:MAG: MBL fold metallo-hydrolase, partial [Candidatus Heimdallarchaeota archaeon]|nr:MBL fold metallo-hydrolase [Candidatus Heimdallarchaeota archaeon]
MYFFKNINYATFRAIIQQLSEKGILRDESLVTYFWLYELIENDFNLDTTISFLNFLEFSRKLGITVLSFSDFETALEKSEIDLKTKNEERLQFKELERIVSNIEDRPEYIDSLSSSISPEILKLLDFHIDYRKLNEISYNLAKFITEQLKIDKKITIANFQKKIEEKFASLKHLEVPTVVDPIFKPHLDHLAAKTIDMTDLAELPNELIREFASIKAYSSPNIAQKVRITFLGGGGIGNMGIIVQHDNNAILLDFGMSVANQSIPRWHPALKFVNAVLVSHAHLDHTGGLPYLISHENEKRWYSSPITKILTEKLLYNTASITRGKRKLSNQLSHLQKIYLQNSNIINLLNSFHPLKPKKTVEISPGFEVTPYPASHLFGSYGYEINVFGKRIFFTGDFSLDKSELFPGAQFPTDCDLTIFDGTYYNRNLPQEDPDTTLLQATELCSKIIIPAFSVGRTQEMITRLARLRISKKRNIIVTGLAADITKTMAIKADYDIKKNFDPADFFENDILITGHGMLQSGSARKLLETTKSSSETGVILCGYQAPNTLGFALKTGNPVALQQYKQRIFSLQISGHSSPLVLNDYINKLSGKKVMVHTPDKT